MKNNFYATACILAFYGPAYATPEADAGYSPRPDSLTIEQIDPLTWHVDYWNSAGQNSGELRETIDEIGCWVSLSVKSGPETLYVNCRGSWKADKPVSEVLDGSGTQVVITLQGF